MKTNNNLIRLCWLGAVLLQAATSHAQPVTNIAAGGSQSFFLKSGGSLWGMGLNGYGDLGDTSPVSMPFIFADTNARPSATQFYRVRLSP